MTKLELNIIRKQIEKLEQISYVLKRTGIIDNDIQEQILNLKDMIYSKISNELIKKD